jgi:hypothetical protein
MKWIKHVHEKLRIAGFHERIMLTATRQLLFRQSLCSLLNKLRCVSWHGICRISVSTGRNYISQYRKQYTFI